MKGIKPLFRLLIIEDDEERIRFFQSTLGGIKVKIVVATSAGQAIGILERDKGMVYGAMFLDHDLNKQTKTDQDITLSGSHIVETIIRNISNDISILVHSMSLTGAAYMEKRLEQAGFQVTRVPMDILFKSKEFLMKWVETARASWDEQAEG